MTAEDDRKKIEDELLDAQAREQQQNNKANQDQNQRITSEDIRFALDTIGKEAPYDGIAIKQIFYGGCSAFTKLPIHHSVNSRKTGSGKSYDLILVTDYFPKKYVIKLAGMSDKALFHEHGVNIIVDEDTGNTILAQPLIDELKSKIEDLEQNGKKKNKKEILECKSELTDLYAKCQKLITLDNKIFLFLDTAQEGLFNTLMSMLSQDSEEQLYKFTDKNSSGKLDAKINRLRGTPTIFTTQVIDDSRQIRYQEKNRRLIHIIPNTKTAKIYSAMDLIGDRTGLLPEEYARNIITDNDRERAKSIISMIVDKIIDHTKLLAHKQSGVKIPFTKSIAHGIHGGSDIGEWGMTVMDRTMRYLAIITKINMDSRPKIIDTQRGRFYPISTFEDLKETLQLMGTASNMLRPYIADWYNRVFAEASKTLTDPKKLTRNVPDSDGKERELILMEESEVGLTTKELVDLTQKIMKLSISSRNLREQYLYPLLNVGIINMSKSVINKNENLWSSVEDSVFSMFHDDKDLRLKILNPALYPDKHLLGQEFRTIIEQEDKKGVENGVFDDDKMLDENGKPSKRYILVDGCGSGITVNELMNLYFSEPETCFIDNNSENKFSENPNSKEGQNDTEIDEGSSNRGDTEDNNNENAKILPSTCPPVLRRLSDNGIEERTITAPTVKPIISVEEFFDGKDKPWKPLAPHTLEQSPCYPIIKLRKDGAYLCKLHRRVNNIHLDSIEHHCKYTEPELHKSKIREKGGNPC